MHALYQNEPVCHYFSQLSIGSSRQRCRSETGLQVRMSKEMTPTALLFAFQTVLQSVVTPLWSFTALVLWERRTPRSCNPWEFKQPTEGLPRSLCSIRVLLLKPHKSCVKRSNKQTRMWQRVRSILPLKPRFEQRIKAVRGGAFEEWLLFAGCIVGCDTGGDGDAWHASGATVA